jgi:hypothetical protein
MSNAAVRVAKTVRRVFQRFQRGSKPAPGRGEGGGVQGSDVEGLELVVQGHMDGPGGQLDAYEIHHDGRDE